MAHSGLVDIRLTGTLRARSGDAEVDERRMGRQGRLLFAYLTVNRARAVPREELAELIWPGGPPPAWEKTLAAAVSRLRAAFAEESVAGPEIVTSGFGCYQINLPDGTTVDLFEAERELIDAEERLIAGETTAAAEAAQAAIEIGSRALLAGEQAEWVERRRAALQEILARALEVLSAARIGTKDAVTIAERVVELDPLRESGHQIVMRAHAAAGDRAAALRAFERCRATLADELGVDPSPQTEAVYLEILRSQRVEHPGPSGVALDIRDGAGSRLVALAGDRVTIGKAPANDVRVDALGASRLHALAERLPAGWTIRDLGSRNGTFVNGEPLTAERALRDGDHIAIGDAVLVYRLAAGSIDTTQTEQQGPVPLSDGEKAVLLALCRPLLLGDSLAEPPPLDAVASQTGRSIDEVAALVGALCSRLAIPEVSPRRLAVLAVQRGLVARSDLPGG